MTSLHGGTTQYLENYQSYSIGPSLDNKLINVYITKNHTRYFNSATLSTQNDIKQHRAQCSYKKRRLFTQYYFSFL